MSRLQSTPAVCSEAFTARIQQTPALTGIFVIKPDFKNIWRIIIIIINLLSLCVPCCVAKKETKTTGEKDALVKLCNMWLMKLLCHPHMVMQLDSHHSGSRRLQLYLEL